MNCFASRHLKRCSCIRCVIYISHYGSRPNANATAFAIAYTPQSLPLVCHETFDHFTVYTFFSVEIRLQTTSSSTCGKSSNAESYIGTSFSKQLMLLMVSQCVPPVDNLYEQFFLKVLDYIPHLTMTEN